MTLMVYISVSDDCRRLIIDGHLELLSKFLTAIDVADRYVPGRRIAASIHPNRQHAAVENEQAAAAQAGLEGATARPWSHEQHE